MNKKKENTLVAFSEWLDKESDAYLLISTKNGDSTLICNGDSGELTVSIAEAIVKYPEISDIIFDASSIVLNALKNEKLN